MDKNLLKHILSIPSYFGHEYLIVDYLVKYGKMKNFKVHKDKKGNVYFQKGFNVEYYPCVVAHLDTAFQEQAQWAEFGWCKTIVEEDGKLTARHPKTYNKRVGMGGDDLAGVFICLQILDQIDNIKAAFFVEEEQGCVGSENADPEFFKDVGYAIEFDAPSNNWYTEYLCGVKIFNSEFDSLVKPILEKNNINHYTSDTYTDVLALRENFGICCCNLPTGYYNYHTKHEYVVLDDVQKAINVGIEFINKLGNKLYHGKDDFDSLLSGYVCIKCLAEFNLVDENGFDLQFCPVCHNKI